MGCFWEIGVRKGRYSVEEEVEGEQIVASHKVGLRNILEITDKGI